jgi:hypothetical protein
MGEEERGEGGQIGKWRWKCTEEGRVDERRLAGPCTEESEGGEKRA